MIHEPGSPGTTRGRHFPVQGYRAAAVALHDERVGAVEGIDAASFDELARKAKETCPVSQALAGTEITLSDVQLA